MNLQFLESKLDRSGIKDDGTFVGYGSTFGNVDRGGDIVAKGAFSKSLKAMPAQKVKLLREHDFNRIAGVWNTIDEDGHGLRVEGKLLLTTDLGRETYELMKAGALDSLSIGYVTKDSERDKSGARLLKQIDLYEISVVALPMNPAATISAVKAEDMTERDFERLLTRDAAESDDQGEVIMADAFSRALAALRTTHP